MYKYSYISIKQDYIRIYTGYRTESWLIIHSFPVHLLTPDADESTIKECLIDCFNNSREITQKEEDDKYYLGNGLLKLLKEKSWKASYNSTVCQVSYRDDEGFRLNFTKYDSKTNSSPIIKEIKLDIKSIDEININIILENLRHI